jgi:hypothetical protein
MVESNTPLSEEYLVDEQSVDVRYSPPRFDSHAQEPPTPDDSCAPVRARERLQFCTTRAHICSATHVFPFSPLRGSLSHSHSHTLSSCIPNCLRMIKIYSC